MEPDDASLPGPDFPAAGDLAFGHFLVPRRADGSLWELGRGAMGVTYRAFDTSLRTDVALKVIHADRVQNEDSRRRFQREARAAAKVRHPNIASVLYLGEEGGEFFYAMEFIAGRSLDALLKETAGPLPAAQAVALAAQAAAALNAAHRREVVHRDLKPANLMLLEDDALDHTDERTDAAGNRLLKVIDFGLARRFGAGRQEDSLVTQTFAGFVGTPAYASPEQCSGETDLDGRSDLYSLGIILWQMLTGRLPFAGRVVEVLGRHQFQDPPLAQLAGLPAPLAELLTGLLIKDPAERRPQTAGELRTTLDRLLRVAPASVPGSAPAADPGAGPRTVSTATENARITAAADAGTAVPPVTEATEEGTRAADDGTATPEVGTTLLTRYRLGREVAQSAGGRLFLAADNSEGGRAVALKLLSRERLAVEPGFAAQVEKALAERVRHPHPVFLAPLGAGVERPGGGGAFYVREWADGFSLDELLRARGGALRASEVFLLLDALPAALDAAAAWALPLFEVALHKLFVVPRAVAAEGGRPADAGDWQGLRTRALEQWPGFALKLHSLGLAPAAGGGGDAAGGDAEWTRIQRRVGADGLPPDPVVTLARLSRELLGAPADGLGPVSALNDEANAVLRRALDRTGGGGRAAFASGVDFWRAWRAAGVAAGVALAATATAPETAAGGGDGSGREVAGEPEGVETVAMPVAVPVAVAVRPLSNPFVKPVPARGSPGVAGPGRRQVLALAAGAALVLVVLVVAGGIRLATRNQGTGSASAEGERVAKIQRDFAPRPADSPVRVSSATAEEKAQAEKALQAAVGSLNEARDAVVRRRGLLDSKVISKQEFDQATNNVQTAEANVSAAEVELRRSHDGEYAAYDHDRAAARLAQARAREALAQLNFDRADDLMAKKVISPEEYAQTASALRKAKADTHLCGIALERVGLTDAARMHRLDLEAAQVLADLQAADTPAATASPVATPAATAATPASVAKTTAQSKLRLVPADYATIQSALDVADPGDTVLVGPGVYTEALRLTNDAIDLRGTDRAKVIVRQDARTGSCLSFHDRRSGRVSNLTFEHTNVDAAKIGNVQFPVIFSDTSTVDLRDCTVRQGGADGMIFRLPTLNVSGDTGFTVSGCTVEGCLRSGIVVTNYAAVLRRQLSASQHAPTEAFGITHGAPIIQAGVAPRLKDNICRNNKEDGIRCIDGAGAVLEENFCEANANNGITITGKGNRSVLTSNRCSNNGKYGVYKDAEAQPVIGASNVYFGNGTAAINP